MVAGLSRETMECAVDRVTETMIRHVIDNGEVYDERKFKGAKVVKKVTNIDRYAALMLYSLKRNAYIVWDSAKDCADGVVIPAQNVMIAAEIFAKKTNSSVDSLIVLVDGMETQFNISRQITTIVKPKLL